jgi:triphosphatase
MYRVRERALWTRRNILLRLRNVPMSIHSIHNDDIDISEQELKFSLAPSDVRKFKSISLLADKRVSKTSLISTYFDTPGNALGNAGISLRVRSSDGRLTQTLKLPTVPPNGLFRREEYEIELSDAWPDIDKVRQHLPAPLRRSLKTALRDVFRVEVRRVEWPISGKSSEIALSLDEGVTRAGERSEVVRELEIELRQGDMKAVFGLAHQIAKVVPLRLEISSKAERGYRLAEGKAISVEKAPRVRLHRNVTVANGFQILASLFIRHFVANEAAFFAEGSPEAVHQMRVAVRRLQLLISFHEDLLSRRERDALHREIQRTSKLLGTARDLDIALMTLDRNGESTRFTAVIPEIHQERKAAYAGVRVMLNSQRFCLFMIDLLALIELFPREVADSSSRRRLGERKLAVDAVQILQSNWKKLRKFKRVSDLSERKRHRLRLRAKALRYASEFFSDLFVGSKRSRRRDGFIDAVTELQDELGELNDRAFVRRLLERPSGAKDAIPAKYRDKEKDSEQALIVTAEKAQKHLCARRPFWC